jgi:hypothetical protein
MTKFKDGQTVTVTLPADAMGKSIDERVVADIADYALFKAGPIVALNHIWGAFNELRADQNYKAAVKLAGMVMRYAQENQGLKL